MSLKNELKGYILENFLFTDDESALDDNDSFMEKGVIDSTGILEVIGFIEENTGIRVDDDDMTPENLDSINNVVAYVEKKKGG